ncbi:MAG: PIG-L family deacetylase [Acidobacteria bacterium]|nr:PIG-L family deacetylase [Acidobacteriota bacterium]
MKDQSSLTHERIAAPRLWPTVVTRWSLFGILILTLISGMVGQLPSGQAFQTHPPPATTSKTPSSKDIACYQALLNLESPSSLLCVAAHPDDEDGASLVYYRMKYGVNTASITATRGEGGQNAVGTELNEALGVIRSYEMQAAAAHQESPNYNLGLEDFGFSKTSREALARWGHDEALRRLVGLIRKLRPDVVITNHDTKTGHGHHQAVGVLLQEAFDAAADPNQFSDQIIGGVLPWQIRRLYERAIGETKPDVTFEVNQVDPYRQVSYVQITYDALKMHATQGPWPNADLSRPVTRRYRLIKSKNAGDLPAGGDNLFAGLESQSKPDFSDVYAGVVKASFQGVMPSERWRQIQSLTKSEEREAARRKLGDEVLGALRSVRTQALNSKDQSRVFEQLADRLAHAYVVLSGIEIQVQATPQLIVPGETAFVRLTIVNGSSQPVSLRQVQIKLADGWQSSGDYSAAGNDVQIEPGNQTDVSFRLTAFPALPPTQPAPEHLYDADFLQPQARFTVTLARNGIRFQVPVPARLEVAHPVVVQGVPREIPAILKEGDIRGPEPQIFTATITRNSARVQAGEIKFHILGGVVVSPNKISVQFGPNQIQVQAKVIVTFLQPLDPKQTRIDMVWTDLSAPPPLPVPKKAAYDPEEPKPATAPLQLASIQVIPVSVALPAKLRVGYVRSFEFTLPQTLKLLGVEHRELQESDWKPGALKENFDTIVLDNRVYLAAPDLAKHQSQLMEFVEQGGHLVVFYHKTGEFKPEWAALPLKVGDRRVAEETAPVTFLLPEHPLLNWPNKLSQTDFDNWVQERGLYFPSEWDSGYQALLASHDTGEEELRGGYLVAHRGKGSYVYTSYAWYRQLRVYHQGTFRTFSNMIAYPVRPNQSE